MGYQAENKTHSTGSVQACQNCKKEFTIESEDFNFYEKIKVPPPTFCRWCRFLRRCIWRNERILYRRACDLCKKNIISMYTKDALFPVYCKECWYGDGWDATSYAKDYDPNRNFFEQYKELLDSVPRLTLWSRNNINCDYSNFCGEARNVYLSCSVIKNSENVFFSKSIDNSKDIVDCMNVINGSESLYENVEAQGNYNSQHLLLSRACIDSYFLVDCANCSNCFMSYNLRNKKFCIRNQQYTREDYFKELAKFNLKSRQEREALKSEFDEMRKKAIYRYGNITKCVNVTGNNMLNVKNSKTCFEIYNMEDSKYCYRAFDSKECMDMNFGGWSELLYEYTTGARNDYNLRFSYSAMDSVRNSDYTDSCRNCSDIFGCISLSNKNYAILNKVYPKDEYFKLRGEIIEAMNTNPFIDRGGRVYRYGEFFPPEFSPHCYNESPAYEFELLTREEAEAKGYLWKEEEPKNFKITMGPESVPDNIDDTDESILNEVIGCAHRGECTHICNFGFRIANYEFSFYKKMGIPIPTLCPNCRYFERVKVMPENKLYERQCMREGCRNEFETAYAPDRSERVYCESCYNKEIY